MKTLVMQGRTGDKKTGRIGDGRGMGGVENLAKGRKPRKKGRELQMLPI